MAVVVQKGGLGSTEVLTAGAKVLTVTLQDGPDRRWFMWTTISSAHRLT